MLNPGYIPFEASLSAPSIHIFWIRQLSSGSKSEDSTGKMRPRRSGSDQPNSISRSQFPPVFAFSSSLDTPNVSDDQVERYHRNFKYECQLIERPTDLISTIDANQRYVRFYNYESPNQAITYGNQPPRAKFPDSPSLPPVPQTIDPDRWLLALTGKTYKRKLDSTGSFQLGNQTYYVQQHYRGQMVLIWVDGKKRILNVFAKKALIKSLSIKGLINHPMNFQEYLDTICKEAISMWQRTQCRTARYREVTI